MNVLIEYKASVQTAAGWRSVYMKAEAVKLSEKRVEILKVTHIDDEPVGGYQSRTGSKRQQFDSEFFAGREVGKRKTFQLYLALVNLASSKALS